jgi:hypothetical protein
MKKMSHSSLKDDKRQLTLKGKIRDFTGFKATPTIVETDGDWGSFKFSPDSSLIGKRNMDAILKQPQQAVY